MWMGNAHVILWTAGCCLGFLAAMAVLRFRGALGWKTIVAVCWAWFGLMVGGVWQARLEQMSFWEAVMFGPADVIGGGGRLPLGLATGAVLAMSWCLVSRAPWRSTGDALAVAAPLTILVGRLGCLAAGCCTGAVCGRWVPGFLCRHPGRSSEEFARQYASGLVDASSAAALPTHPLPVYFMIAAVLLLAVLLWQLRRRAPPGTLLVTFGMLWPVGKLALEQLRENPRPPGLMTAVPVAMLLASAALAAAMTAERRRVRWLGDRVTAPRRPDSR